MVLQTKYQKAVDTQMAYRSLGGAKPQEFIPKEREQAMIRCNVDPEFHDKLKNDCSENQIKLSQ